MKNTTIAVDLAKSVFQVAVSHRPGHVEAERRLSRERLLEYLALGRHYPLQRSGHRAWKVAEDAVRTVADVRERPPAA
jgi:hypothetical protein